jgi:SAM-dependent methyltransferase
MSLRDAWETNADAWVRWARTPDHDVYSKWHAGRFVDLLPPPGRLTVDLGAGEGRLGRDLADLGHRVVAVDSSPTLATACATHEHALPTIIGDAAAIPLPTRCADLVVAFMSLQDVDDLTGAVAEAARLLEPDGYLCAAIVHPLNSAGAFDGREGDAPFIVRGSYLEAFRYHDDIERDGLVMDFHSEHRPLESYSRALEDAGLVIEAIRELTTSDGDDRWSRIPMFLHWRARPSAR